MVSSGSADAAVGDGYFLPELLGDKPDFWEGNACGIALATYNEGTTDFKDTPVYKEAIGSRELLDEQPDDSFDVFESNPTEVAPSLD
ncbi:hypothetical protein MLD38_032829 [Melastoma candidum]|uniref:Uncharacterized protein n=1 Tax=Melastoma candidum TaxID=119954 RepID=A0ACB9M6V7_9MYRT|nr:hypothetical protein MLD38_032829 [Melastoma candidum]